MKPNVRTKFISDCKRLYPAYSGVCDYGKMCLRKEGGYIAARKHFQWWTEHDVKEDEKAIIEKHSCLDCIDLTKPIKKAKKVKKEVDNG
jgi:hypothetical protein